ncbi:uncharacterized protein EDB93DRAFT_1103811 [Suillus bovinus]|uniref:uncharacterized protein n=1 Tax=Suillus bovinus TaxID=48563 RepID=UPI001B873DDD|nr:uncharacterized protein EDB93DRAFT_1103811 [Suillus bovinus]KAG2148142.1 hypothetical protein EDB93DRAFT_1103811 [Suillus bovinus]
MQMLALPQVDNNAIICCRQKCNGHDEYVFVTHQDPITDNSFNNSSSGSNEESDSDEELVQIHTAIAPPLDAASPQELCQLTTNELALVVKEDVIKAHGRNKEQWLSPLTIENSVKAKLFLFIPKTDHELMSHKNFGHSFAKASIFGTYTKFAPVLFPDPEKPSSQILLKTVKLVQAIFLLLGDKDLLPEEDFKHALEDEMKGPVFSASTPLVLSLPSNEPLPSIDDAETNDTHAAAQIGPSESISTAMQDLFLGLDTQDQVVSEHDNIDMPVIADTTTKPKPKPKPKHEKGKTVNEISLAPLMLSKCLPIKDKYTQGQIILMQSHSHLQCTLDLTRTSLTAKQLSHRHKGKCVNQVDNFWQLKNFFKGVSVMLVHQPGLKRIHRVLIVNAGNFEFENTTVKNPQDCLCIHLCACISGKPPWAQVRVLVSKRLKKPIFAIL